jgi:hypothetical protein
VTIDRLHGTQVLDSNPSDVKALYRRAQAHLGAQDFVEAHVDIKAALQVFISPFSTFFASRTQ